jgi:hypothetical protein
MSAYPGNIGPGLGQSHRHGLADASAAAGHHGQLAIQFEEIQNAHFSALSRSIL